MPPCNIGKYIDYFLFQFFCAYLALAPPPMSTICSSSPPLPPSSHLNLSTLALDAEARAETEEPEEEEEEEELLLLVDVDQRAEGEGAEHSSVSVL